MSGIELFTLYMPVTQNSMMSGSIPFFGTRSMLANSGTNGRLSSSRMKLPMYMLATTAQNSSGFSAISSGPGGTPWMSSAPRGKGGPRPAGKPAGEEADPGAAENRSHRALQVLERRIQLAKARHRDALLELAARLRGVDQDLPEAEHPDPHRDKLDPAQQMGRAEGEARVAGDRVEADGAEDEAHHHHHQRLDERAAGDVGKHHEGEDHQRSELRRTESERRVGERRPDPPLANGSLTF